MSDARPPAAFWATLESAQRPLEESFDLSRVEYVVSFSPPWEVSAWLGTKTDDERERLIAQPTLNDEVVSLLRRLGREEVG